MAYVPEILCFMLGLVAGTALYHNFFSKRSKLASTAHELDKIQSEYTDYQQKVDQHFQKSAKLINHLTQTYSEVHQHLQEGAQSLSSLATKHTPALDQPMNDKGVDTKQATEEHELTTLS